MSRASGRDRYAALATLLRERREVLGWSRKDVCAHTGLSYPYISQLESGYRAPSLGTARKLADTLGLDVEEIVVLADDAITGQPAGRQTFANPGFASRPALNAATSPPSKSADAEQSEELVTAPPPPHRASRRAVITSAAALLTSLPAEDRLDALSAVQRQVVNSILAEGPLP
jgi:transcriptional regulator with XRE-family HTH domain